MAPPSSVLSSDWVLLHVGVDDTDSPSGGCTTYLGTLLTALLLSDKTLAESCSLVDYPNLIRLNPNIPFRTRGNGAIAIRLRADPRRINLIFEKTAALIDTSARLDHPNTQPGLVLLQGAIPYDLKNFALQAIREVIPREQTITMLRNLSKTVHYKGFNGGRGLTGALAAVGMPLTEADYTFELITYRHSSMWGTPRRVDKASVEHMNTKTSPDTFASIDPMSHEILITPHGPDPVLYGIRGNTAKSVHTAHLMVKSDEPIERWLIFRTNQATNQHIPPPSLIRDARPLTPIQISGEILSPPRTIPGGHVLVPLSDDTGTITLAAYEPTHEFRGIIRQLYPGDRVTAVGSVRPACHAHGLTVNLEAITIHSVAPLVRRHPPTCPLCARTMTSDGHQKGYKCRSCNQRFPEAQKTSIIEPRPLMPGYYQVPACAFRHLTKPVERLGRENQGYAFKPMQGELEQLCRIYPPAGLFHNRADTSPPNK